MMMNQLLRKSLVLLISLTILGCGSGVGDTETEASEGQPKMVKKKREDGTLSSVNPVDEDGYVHGVKVNYYEDGKTVHSQITYQHGRKHGPAIWYYKNGQIGEHATFHYGRKHGPTKRYYETGELREEATYEKGIEMLGKKTYNREGELISSN